jgi:hypothetical protein
MKMEESVSKCRHTKSEAGELSTRKRKTLRTLRKFETKNNQNMFIIEEFRLICQSLSDCMTHEVFQLNCISWTFKQLMQIGEKILYKFLVWARFNVMKITFIKLRVKVPIKPYICWEIIPNSKATTLSARNITVRSNSWLAQFSWAKHS